ncbi:MAG: cobyrinate a,c-diamide synthase [Clostridium sp.]|nr:cobyrinate a,c-diamide synthase [Clostridium sp.]
MSGIMITAPKSGSGKTMITCGLLALLKRRGLKPSAFKCGPDYIDGLFHRNVLGVESGCLDLFFEGPEQMRDKFLRYSLGKFAVAEGAMGYYDGLGGVSLKASAWEVAETLELPAFLVVDAHGAGLSIAAQIQGFLEFDTGKGSRNQGKGNSGKGWRNQIAGVIFNRMSPGMYGSMKAEVEGRLGAPVAGYVPELDFLKVDSRHLGLVLPDEIGGLKLQMERLADCLEKSLDLDLIVQMGGGDRDKTGESGLSDAGGALLKEGTAGPGSRTCPGKFRLGIAMDEAFCFYYRENLEAMEAAGARLVYFSPVHDKELPPGLGGMILGGGYPENYAGALSGNYSMKRAVREAARDGMPILGECGGYLYLLEELEGADGRVYPMAGVFKGRGCRVGRNPRFGYITVTADRELPFLEQGDPIKAHEFHYWDCACDEKEYAMTAVKPVGKRSWPCMRAAKNTVAGFPHLYYGSCPRWVQRFAEKCIAYKSVQEGSVI